MHSVVHVFGIDSSHAYIAFPTPFSQTHAALAAVGTQAAPSLASGESYAIVDLGAGVRTLVQEGNWYACSQQLGTTVRYRGTGFDSHCKQVVNIMVRFVTGARDGVKRAWVSKHSERTQQSAHLKHMFPPNGPLPCDENDSLC